MSRTSIAAATVSALRDEKAVLDDEGHGQRLVADAVEAHGDGVAFVAEDLAAAPLGVGDTGVDSERSGVRLWYVDSRVAAVTVAARLVEHLAEVAQQQLPSAAARFGVRLHHLHPRFVHLL